MLDIGFLELMLLGVVGLLVLGPERLPKAARTAGLWVGKVKRTVSGMQREISAQLEAEELRQQLNEQQKKLDDSLTQAKRNVESLGDAPSRSTPGAPATTPEPTTPSTSESEAEPATEQSPSAPLRPTQASAAAPATSPEPSPAQQKDTPHQ